jgi:hypothetical protein
VRRKDPVFQDRGRPALAMGHSMIRFAVPALGIGRLYVILLKQLHVSCRNCGIEKSFKSGNREAHRDGISTGAKRHLSPSSRNALVGHAGEAVVGSTPDSALCGVQSLTGD